MNGPESIWAADLLDHPSATRTSNLTDTQIFSDSLLHQLPPSDSVVRLWQPPAPHHPSVRDEVAFVGVGETFLPHLVDPMTLPESHPVRKPTARSLSNHVSASRLLAQSSAAPPIRSPRYTPYPIGPENTRRGASPASGYQCQWFDGAGPCSAVVAGTKIAIGRHLRITHAIQLKADKTVQLCHWEGCHKSMRRESIPRHILAVHMLDKVLCPSCGSRFARSDSLQRHQRTQCLAKGEASDACKAGE
jgi:uncharacterized protein YodC (DUF2158 family)